VARWTSAARGARRRLELARQLYRERTGAATEAYRPVYEEIERRLAAHKVEQQRQQEEMERQRRIRQEEMERDQRIREREQDERCTARIAGPDRSTRVAVVTARVSPTRPVHRCRIAPR